MGTQYEQLVHHRAYITNRLAGLLVATAFAVLLWPVIDMAVTAHLGPLPPGSGDWGHRIPGLLATVAGVLLFLTAYFTLCRIVEKSATTDGT